VDVTEYREALLVSSLSAATVIVLGAIAVARNQTRLWPSCTLRGIGPEPICVLWRGGHELSTADTGTEGQARWHDNINTVRFRVLRVFK
jgi:hypothetical protein